MAKLTITHQDIFKALTETGFQTKLEKTMIGMPLCPQFLLVTFFYLKLCIKDKNAMQI